MPPWVGVVVPFGGEEPFVWEEGVVEGEEPLAQEGVAGWVGPLA